MAKKDKKKLMKNGSQRNRNNSKTIVINGKTYMRLYDDNGELPEDLSMLGLNKEGVETSIEELKSYGLIEIIERKGIEYYRMLEPINR